jgi:diguanylate cyclase (GGDEF)-like protein
MIDLPTHKAWGWTILTFATLAIVDYATGPKIWLGSFYLLVICLASGSLGARAGLLVGSATVAISIAANGLSFFEAGSAIAWNIVMRLLTVIMVVALVGGFRRSIGRERLLARTDPLTGALTRQAFLDGISRTATDSRTRGAAILAYIDLDEFKQVNDLHGHAAGDAVLRAFAHAVRSTLLPTDRFARVGGDEFLLLLPVRGAPTSDQITALLHARLGAIVIGLPHRVTCSVGAVLLDVSTADIMEADIERADRLMYEVKRVGGNAMRIAVGEAPAARDASRPHRIARTRATGRKAA